MIPLLIVLGIIALLVIAFVAIYNGLVRLRNEVKNSWAQIDVQLKRRYDLIPNLVEAVKGYVKHERETLEAVTKARNLAQQLSTSESIGARGKAEGELSSALMRLLAVAESYPDLKANQNFLSLQEELASTENKISFSRQYYNDSVLKLNNQVQMFPSNIVASVSGFHAGEFFEVTVAAEKEAPKVKFT
jgi:LemA protein